MKVRKFYRGYNSEYQNIGSPTKGLWVTKNPQMAIQYALSNNSPSVEVFYLNMDNFKCANLSKLKKIDANFSPCDQIPEQITKLVNAGYDAFNNGEGGMCILNTDRIIKHYRIPWNEMERKLQKLGYNYDVDDNINNIPNWKQKSIDDGYETIEDLYDENGRSKDFTIDRIKEKYVENNIRLTEKDIRYIISESVKRIIKETKINNKLSLDYLKQYLTMPDNEKFLYNVKCRQWDFIQFLKAERLLGPSKTYSSFKQLIANYEQYIIQFSKKIINAKTEYLYNGNVDVTNQNANMFMKYMKDDNGWLFHFTNQPYSIVQNGFMGVTNMNSLHRTYGRSVERETGKGYGFAYSLNNLPQTNHYKANYLVLFKAPSITVKHNTDKEIQNIFDVTTVDYNSIFVFKLNNKQGEINYSDDGDSYADSPTIESMVCCYPESFRGLTANTPVEAIKTIEKGKFKPNDNSAQKEEINRVVSFFKKLGNHAEIWENFHGVGIEYKLTDSPDDFENKEYLVPHEYLLGSLVRKFNAEGYDIVDRGRQAILYNNNTNTTLYIRKSIVNDWRGDYSYIEIFVEGNI